jgi:hypothetical protein
MSEFDKIKHDLKKSVLINCSHNTVAGAEYVDKEFSVSQRRTDEDNACCNLWSTKLGLA